MTALIEQARAGELGEARMVKFARATAAECSARYIEVVTELAQMHCLHRDDRKTAQGHQTTIWFTERAPVAAA